MDNPFIYSGIHLQSRLVISDRWSRLGETALLRENRAYTSQTLPG